MPVSNNFLTNRSPTLDLTGVTLNANGGGFVAKDVKQGFYLLKPNSPLVIVPEIADVNREIYIEIINLFTKDSFVNLYFKNKNLYPKKLLPDEVYIDQTDGGIALVAEAFSELILMVTIRQNSKITYPIGNYTGDDEMPVELIVRPVAQTGERYSMPPIIPSSIGDANLRKIIDSNNGLITGCKAWALDQFQEGKTYNFTVEPNGKIAVNTPIRILLVKIEDILKCFAALDASDESELDQVEIATDLIGWIKANSYFSEININESQTFELKPSRTRYVLVFDAGNPTLPGNYTDTVIANYSKNNADPYQGGIFTFLGF